MSHELIVGNCILAGDMAFIHRAQASAVIVKATLNFRLKFIPKDRFFLFHVHRDKKLHEFRTIIM